LKNDKYPGKCGRYIDINNDAICDHSQTKPEPNKIAEKKINAVTVSEFCNLISSKTFNGIIIDLRTKDQYDENHIKKAIHLPIESLRDRIASIEGAAYDTDWREFECYV
jgi:hypothetical protein